MLHMMAGDKDVSVARAEPEFWMFFYGSSAAITGGNGAFLSRRWALTRLSR